MCARKKRRSGSASEDAGHAQDRRKPSFVATLRYLETGFRESPQLDRHARSREAAWAIETSAQTSSRVMTTSPPRAPANAFALSNAICLCAQFNPANFMRAGLATANAPCSGHLARMAIAAPSLGSVKAHLLQIGHCVTSSPTRRRRELGDDRAVCEFPPIGGIELALHAAAQEHLARRNQ